MSDARVKRRRLASGQACIACRGRKHRCDGARPVCGSCVSRSDSSACQYPPKGTGPTIAEAPSPHSASSNWTMHGESQPQAQQQASICNATPTSANISPGVLPPHQITVTRYTGEDEAGQSSASPAVHSGGPDGFFGRSSTFAFISEVSPHAQSEHDLHNQSMQYSVQSLPAGAQSLPGSTRDSAQRDSRHMLPDRTLANNLVDAYFERVHPLYPFVHEGTFRSEYERIWANPNNSSMPASWYALLNMIFASGCEFCDVIPETELMQTVAPFVARSREIIISHAFKNRGLELVQALLLMCHYLQGTMELNECWTLAGLMFRSAVTSGLHLSPERLSLSIVEKEVRKRVWWGCFILDRTLSWKFGRPTSIQATDVLNVPLPLAIDDQYLQSNSIAPRQPVGRPPTLAFFLHTVKLAHIIDQILGVLYTTNKEKPQQSGTATPSHTDPGSFNVLGQAVLLDGQLQMWWNERPLHLHPKSGLEGSRIFERQETVMQLRYLQIRILLHRQLLLMFSRRDIGDYFLRAIAIAGSQVCISAAKETIRLVYKRYRRNLLNSLRYNLHYIFTSMGVLLHLYSMDKSKLELLGYEQEGEIFEWGMEFLTAASTTSMLAARYAAMLQGVRPRSSHDDALSAVEQGEGWLPGSSRAGDLGMPQPGIQPWQFRGLHNARGDIDLDGMNFDDLLLGTGLPQDIISLGYPSGGYDL